MRSWQALVTEFWGFYSQAVQCCFCLKISKSKFNIYCIIGIIAMWGWLVKKYFENLLYRSICRSGTPNNITIFNRRWFSMFLTTKRLCSPQNGQNHRKHHRTSVWHILVCWKKYTSKPTLSIMLCNHWMSFFGMFSM